MDIQALRDMATIYGKIDAVTTLKLLDEIERLRAKVSEYEGIAEEFDYHGILIASEGGKR